MTDGGQGTAVIRVFLLDDHEIVRRGVREMLEAEPDITVIGEAGTAESALARIPALMPDVAVLDVRLPDGDGVTVCREIRSRMPQIACLMLTSFGDDEALFDAIMAGAAGYVLKQIRGTDLVGAVRTVASGESMLDPEAASKVMARMRDQANQQGSAGRPDPAGAQDPRAHRRGPDEQADRRADVPGREDREELRLRAVRQAWHGAPYAGGRVRDPGLRPGRARSAPVRAHARRHRRQAPLRSAAPARSSSVPPLASGSTRKVPPSLTARCSMLASPLRRPIALDARAVVADRQRQVGGGSHLHVDLAGVRVPGGVGERLAQHA